MQYVSRYETFEGLEKTVAELDDIISVLETQAANLPAESMSDGPADSVYGLLLGTPGAEAPLSRLAAKMDAIDYSILQAGTANALLSLATTTARLRGLDLTNHPLTKEKARMKTVLEDVDKLVSEPVTHIDQEAAARVVEHHTKPSKKSKRRRSVEVVEID
eukprot:Blabericola_migrator_1__13579@NODE_99_length_14373_cov_95_300643_g89_i0_p9_GENE_NODE_99_length_14373_cov_95_300643_g89_i0NODE_99_length_14373_cov_95_300643_g89_i0_p9_ORF_typecomplete_len161_score42_49DUF2730/PF10805_8/0_5DUF2730/PF10805_8/4_6e02CdvA/PF18822_1/6_7CdvA/PF18822_1/35Sas10_Utp3/PF04000_15/0_29_NODE_99_length_14373_cov_95_300643_g89_i071377619